MKKTREKDRVVSGLNIKEDNLVFQMDELYKVMKEWGEINRYRLIERTIQGGSSVEMKEERIEWHLERKLDDFTKFVIRVIIKLSGKDINIKSRGKALKGGCDITIDSWLLTDYEREWEVIPIFKFIKGFYDKFVLFGKYDRYFENLKKDTYGFFNEIKAFLDLNISR